MNRRAFLGGLAGMAGALVLPASVTENAAEARRWWALGAMPGREVKGLDELFPAWREELAARPLGRYTMGVWTEELTEDDPLRMAYRAWTGGTVYVSREAGLIVAQPAYSVSVREEWVE